MGIVQDIEQRIKIRPPQMDEVEWTAVGAVDPDSVEITEAGGAALGMAQPEGTPPRKQVSPLRLVGASDSPSGAAAEQQPRSAKAASELKKQQGTPSPSSSPSRGRTDGFFEITPLKLGQPSPIKPAATPPRAADSMGVDPPGLERDEGTDEVTEYVIIDFGDVNGVDATAARSCFLQLAHILHSHGIGLVLTGMRPRVQSLLQAHGVITDDSFVPSDSQTAAAASAANAADAESAPEEEEKEAPLCRVFDTLDLALEDCEENILASCPPPTPLKVSGTTGGVSRKLTLSGSSSGEGYVLTELEPEPEPQDTGQLARILSGFVEGDEELSALQSTDLSRLGMYFERLELEPRTVIFSSQDPATDIFVIESGDVSLLATAEGLETQVVSALPTAAGAVMPTATSGETAEGGAVDAVDGGSVEALPMSTSLLHRLAPRTGTSIGDAAESAAAALIESGAVDMRRRVQRFRDGGLFGGLDFFLQQRRSFTAEVTSDRPCVVHKLSRARMRTMATDDPGLASLVHLVCLKSLCLDVQSISYLL